MSKSNKYKTVIESYVCLLFCLSDVLPSEVYFEASYCPRDHMISSHWELPRPLISQPPPPLDSDLLTRTCGSSTHEALKTRRCFGLDSWIVPAWSLKNK